MKNEVVLDFCIWDYDDITHDDITHLLGIEQIKIILKARL